MPSAARLPRPGQTTPESQGIQFRLLPGGYYLLGSPVSEPGRYADEDTPHRLRLDVFYIAVTETNSAQYARFLKATGQAPPYYLHVLHHTVASILI